MVGHDLFPVIVVARQEGVDFAAEVKQVLAS